MKEHKTYTTAGAFRRALEERLKKTSQTDQTDINRLRRQVSFDRLLARLFRDDSVPWVLKGGLRLGASLQDGTIHGRHRPDYGTSGGCNR
jgi:hypothetical protein